MISPLIDILIGGALAVIASIAGITWWAYGKNGIRR